MARGSCPHICSLEQMGFCKLPLATFVFCEKNFHTLPSLTLPLVSSLQEGDTTYGFDFVLEIDLEAAKGRWLEVLLGYKCQFLFIIF